MNRMFKNANSEEVEKIRKEGLYGFEFDDGLYTLAIANMIIRKDGKSNIYKGDCFNEQITKELKNKNINIGLINPPYSQDDKEELEYKESEVEIQIIGKKNIKEVPILLSAILIGLVDGFNPCAMWILIFLISMLLGLNNKKRRLALGITFLVASALVYFLFFRFGKKLPNPLCLIFSTITISTQNSCKQRFESHYTFLT